jgi:xyloglucan-specific endo-beta-1,4-glucanase
MKVYSFVRAGNNDIKNFKADLKLFFNHLVQNYQFPEAQQNLIGK